MSRRKSPSANQNWVADEVKALIKSDAKKCLESEKKKEAGSKVVYIPHPTIRNTLIRKII